MGKTPGPDTIIRILRRLDWSGHVEIGDNDITWLANELAVALSPTGEAELCEMCDTIKPIVVKTSLGRICEDCLEDLTDEASDMREQLEE
jgi:hypothetical protein